MMSLAAYVNKEARRDSQIMNPFPVFEMATRTAPEAIGWADRFGSLEIGKAAELAIFDMSGPSWWPAPFANPVTDFVYGGTAQDARTVLIDGRIVMEDGVVSGVD
jgi:5-methylthioadenosine/S-adenosylhomocysteine deaminase